MSPGAFVKKFRTLKEPTEVRWGAEFFGVYYPVGTEPEPPPLNPKLISDLQKPEVGFVRPVAGQEQQRAAQAQRDAWLRRINGEPRQRK